MQNIKPTLICLFVLTGQLPFAQTLRLEQIIDSIQTSHPAVKMYDNEIRSMDEASKGPSLGWLQNSVLAFHDTL